MELGNANFIEIQYANVPMLLAEGSDSESFRNLFFSESDSFKELQEGEKHSESQRMPPLNNDLSSSAT